MPPASSTKSVNLRSLFHLLRNNLNNPYRFQFKLRSDSPFNNRITPARISIPRVLAVFALVSFLLISYQYEISLRTPQLRGASLHFQQRLYLSLLVTPPLVPESQVIGETELFYLVPPMVQDTKGVLIFFHGCNRSGQDMFRLPEDRVIALAALNRNLAVVAITSADRDTGCWGPQDAEILQRDQIVSRWMESIENGLSSSLPRMGMGVGSGATFLFSVVQDLGLQSVASYASPGVFPESDTNEENAHPLPPTVFVHSARDKVIAKQVEDNQEALTKAGIPAESYSVRPHPFTADLCDRRLPEVGDRRCHHFVRYVVKEHPNLMAMDSKSLLVQPYLDEDHGSVNEAWKSVLQELKFDDDLRHSVMLRAGARKNDDPLTPTPPGKLTPSARSGHSWMWAAVEQEIAVAFGANEVTCEHRAEVLDFLMKHAKIGIQNKSPATVALESK